jgi:transcriptional regulator with XRE-family HTH domain
MPGMSADKARVAERIRAARAAKGWKQKHLAAQVSVEPITVSRWERGATTPDFDALGLISEATGKPLSYFLGDDAQPAVEPSLADAVERIEAAAAKIAADTDRIAAMLAEVRSDLLRPR